MQADFLKWLFKRRGERLSLVESRQLFRGGMIGALIIVVVTLGIWGSDEVYGGFERLSYDLPFIFKQKQPREVRMVYMSEVAAKHLGQSFGIWNRSVHTKLIRRLKAEGARAIFFDLVLIDPYDSLVNELGLQGEPYLELRRQFLKIDDDLHAAIRDHGQVYFGAMQESAPKSMGGVDVRLLHFTPPHDALLDALGDHWGALAFDPIDSDYAVRRYFGGPLYVPSATWVLANEMGAGLGDEWSERLRERWLNYYGPPESIIANRKGEGAPGTDRRDFTFDGLDYDLVLLRPEDVPKDFFRDKVVFVGLKNQLGSVDVGKDEFRHPTSRWTGQYCNGVEVHATAFVNLLNHEWLTRLNRKWELGIFLVLGALLAISGARSLPWMTIVGSVLASAAIAGIGMWSQLEWRVWWAWTLPIILQVPFALIWGISTRYVLVERRRASFRRALSHYLSEDVAAAMVDQGFALRLGGENRLASMMFTDLEGFTTFSETLPPEKLARVLSAYFQRTNRHIQENRGAILRYIGDAILAVWNAPRDCADHAVRACAAAREIARLNAEPLVVDGEEFRLRTRVGVHTGEVIACNVGSEDRFDYTVLGDNTNLAARLEGLNKFFGTTVLTTGGTAARLDGTIGLRRLGEIIVKGRTEPVTVLEVLLEPLDPAWAGAFERALASFATGAIDSARAQFIELARTRPDDGPAQFYLARIASGETAWPLKMDEK